MEKVGEWDLELDDMDHFKTEADINRHVQQLMTGERTPGIEALRSAFNSLMTANDSMSFKHWLNEALPEELAYRYVCIPHIKWFWNHIAAGKWIPGSTELNKPQFGGSSGAAAKLNMNMAPSIPAPVRTTSPVSSALSSPVSVRTTAAGAFSQAIAYPSRFLCHLQCTDGTVRLRLSVARSYLEEDLLLTWPVSSVASPSRRSQLRGRAESFFASCPTAAADAAPHANVARGLQARKSRHTQAETHCLTEDHLRAAELYEAVRKQGAAINSSTRLPHDSRPESDSIEGVCAEKR
ncbi:hypothetical protein DPEC_G00068460 [Dallia pectoralis]|uniref:Uncharacterized protein n=1 Tax=Dallia pectoralis TaxID=75939 RepID=A0ACC2H1K4_DALPE|nr:hypothetical protein DPEC_G00068460 [Dallia pectoralis]